MVASFARLALPDKIYASVSSSAPVEAAVEMTGYWESVAGALSNPVVGGSNACLGVVQRGHEKIGEMLAAGRAERASLATTFNLCPASLSAADVEAEDPLGSRGASFLFAGSGVVAMPGQENDPACGGNASSVTACYSGLCSFLVRERARLGRSAGDLDADVLALASLRRAQGDEAEATEGGATEAGATEAVRSREHTRKHTHKHKHKHERKRKHKRKHKHKSVPRPARHVAAVIALGSGGEADEAETCLPSPAVDYPSYLRSSVALPPPSPWGAWQVRL